MAKEKKSQGGPNKLNSVVLDSKLLVLYLIGSYDLNQIANYKRSSMFSLKDFYQLVKIINSFRTIILNQPIITEACNHLDKLNEYNNYSLYTEIKSTLIKYSNDSVSTNQILNGDAFIPLGFADSSLELLSKYNVVLTDDAPLYGRIMRNSGNVLFWGEVKNFYY